MRAALAAATTFYVNPSTGNDGNDGLTAATAWKTPQHAWDTLAQGCDTQGYAVTIQLADGTYTSSVNCEGRLLGQIGWVTWLGNHANPSNVLFSIASANTFECIASEVFFDGIKFAGTGSTVGILSYFYTRVGFQNCEFGAMGSGIHLSASGGIILAQSDYKISGGAGYHALADGPGSKIVLDDHTITLNGTPNFSSAFAVAEQLGLVSAYGDTFVGSATGMAYIVQMLGLLTTGYADPSSYLPGNAAGSKSTGGICV